MVQPRVHNAELTQSVARLVDALPFYNGSSAELAEALVDAAGNCYRPGRVSDVSVVSPDIYDPQARIIEYAKDLTRHASTSKIADVESLIADFVWFLTQPLKVAERDVRRLDLSVLAELSQHEAMSVTNVDFHSPDAARRAEDLFKKFIERVRAYPEEIDVLMKRVEELERIFHDPEGIILRMRGSLRDIGGMIAQLDDAARMVLKLGDNDILRAKWLKNIHATFDDHMDEGVVPGAGVDSVLAGACGFVGGAQVIPLRFDITPTS